MLPAELEPFSCARMSRVSDKSYSVYILWSDSAHRFYIGISEDPQSRLGQHNAGTQHSWTARHRPLRLIWTEKHTDYPSAKKRENELKAQKGRKELFESRINSGLRKKFFAALLCLPPVLSLLG